ncbi:hypothetical protein C900_00007 [Fulvivirga imtechensis AK7]|uniref:Outer membrane protein beta-barrel domain-containing protein n=1 Tax=Fulvivirga imtechensis AK7 TaxID=1237149 RepID=L8K0C4_9BACT|nr:outer membrane beta-barrel protein [Fulvivirga imtechensis]ELR73843.1 hypothetical protein C900_00007 [Fulvivirga imtechensis AK7]
MKKFLLVVFALVGFLASVNAQTEKGSITAGGNISIDFEKEKFKSGSTTVDVGNNTSFTFNPLVGFFIMDGLAAGLEVNLQTSKFKSDDDTFESKFNAISIGPFVKYYHTSGAFGMGSIGFGSAKSESTNNNNTNEAEFGLFTWRLGGGYALFLNDHVSLEPMLSYGSFVTKDKDSDQDEKDITNGFQISVGFHIFLK